MVRTKASTSSSSGIRAVAAKAPRKSLGSSYSGGQSSSSGSSTPNKRSDKFCGGNSYFPRPTPQWQKPISGFFSVQTKDKSFVKSITKDVDNGVNKENIDPGVSGTSMKSIQPSHSKGITNEKPHNSKNTGASPSGSSLAATSSSSCAAGSSGLSSSTAGSSGIKEKRRRLMIESDSDDD